MKAKIIDGKQVSSSIKKHIKHEIENFKSKPGLAVVLVGKDPASMVYVKNKIMACQEVGIKSFEYSFSAETTTTNDLRELIETLNADANVNGILVQLPLPKHIDEQYILSLIDHKKDVDGFLAMNIGNLFLGNPCKKACTPWGCIQLIKSTGVQIAGKHAVVVGRSNIVGKPLVAMLLEENATVTVCHSKTNNLKDILLQADIVVMAIGRANFLTGDMVKDGAIVIDVGINRIEGKLCGDVDFDSVVEKAGYITPVPGGVGPMTIAMLMQNTYNAFLEQNK